MAEFTHLHLHTQYSLLDGAIRVDDLFPAILERGMKSAAITDHGNLFGTIHFYEKAKAHGVKPIFGCETYVAPDRLDKTQRRSHHLILLAKNNVGWRNLSYLNSMGFLEGFYYNPRIDKKLLREHSEGLIGLSACLGGEMAQSLMRRGESAAIDVAREYESIFGKGNFFMEIQPNGLEEQETVNGQLIEISKKTEIPLIATNDCHYLNRKDARPHEILMCVQQKRTINDEDRMHHRTDAYYVKSPSEMNAYFTQIPQAMENAARIGDLCNVELDLGKNLLPRFKVPNDADPHSYLRALAERGLKERLEAAVRLGKKVDGDHYLHRLELELGVITKMDFSGYFLIVWDFINFAKKNSIPVGPGRGSGAGSLVAYSLRITDIDPIENKLLFERFLNPERVSMPDFDIDFCMNRRDEVIHYVSDKYGKDNVGQIVTMHQLKARSCIRDVARALGMPVAEANKVASMIPEPVQGKSPPIAEAIEQEPRLKEAYEGEYRELLETAMVLEGLNRHAGKHAAGVVIAEMPLWNYVPCFKPANEEGIVTQFNMTDVEKVGLVKFDFLGLKTLTVIQTALDLVNREKQLLGQEPVDISAIPLEDPAVYGMISRADVTGVFQLESSGFRELLKKLKPDCFEDIVAAGALYRPGPLEGGMVDDFIERKHGRRKVEYVHPSLEPILKDTYGVIVYQEQVMQIASAMAGYSLGGADLLRRAMGKKKHEVMVKEKEKFLTGARAREVDAGVAEGVFDLMAKFAGYGFNRSHSAAYGLLTYQTAFLKHYFPVEFFAALMTCDKDSTENVVKFISEAREQGIVVERPDVSESDANFTVVELTAAEGEKAGPSRKSKSGQTHQTTTGGRKGIRFGLAAVKGVGEGAVEIIQQVRDAGKPFESVYDFCNRVDQRKVNRKVVEALVKSGAFDGIAEKRKVARSMIFRAITPALERAASSQRERDSGQTSLLALLSGDSSGTVGVEPVDDSYSEGVDWKPLELLAFEKESLGFYISGHPLDGYKNEVRRFCNALTTNATARGPRAEVTIAGVVLDFQERQAKSGGKFAFFKLEDQHGQIEFIVRTAKLTEFRDVLQNGEPLMVRGTVDTPFGDGAEVRQRLLFNDARPLASIRLEKSKLVEIRVDANSVSETALESLEVLLRQHQGPCRTRIVFEIPERSRTMLELGSEYSVNANDDLLSGIELLFGTHSAVLH
jgi:DNA polymerase III subunit alpha